MTLRVRSWEQIEQDWTRGDRRDDNYQAMLVANLVAAKERVLAMVLLYPSEDEDACCHPRSTTE